MTKAATEAEQLLDDLGLTEVPVIPAKVCVAMSSSSFRVTYEEKSMTTDNFHGISMGDAQGAAILINADIPNRHRKRFTAAHEIGHVHLHIQTNIQSQFKCTSKDILAGEHSNDVYEKEANTFASSLLMPASAIMSLVHRTDLTWRLVEKIASLCDVSLEAAARRAVTLSKDSCSLIVHDRDTMWNPIKSQKFSTYIPTQPFPSHLETQPYGSTESSLTDDIDDCEFSDWALPDNAAGKLLYSSIHNDDFNRTMTLLVHQEEVYDEETVYENDPCF